MCKFFMSASGNSHSPLPAAPDSMLPDRGWPGVGLVSQLPKGAPKMFSKALWEVVRDVGGGLDVEVEVEEVKNSQNVGLLDDGSSSFGQEVDP